MEDIKKIMEDVKEIINKPEFIVGVIFGVISSIPYINYCCCLLYVLSGVISAHIKSKEGDLSDEEYLDCGGLSGIVAGLTTSFLDYYLNFTTPMEDYHYPGNYGGVLLSLIIRPIFFIIFFIIYLSVGTIFGAIGGIIYGKLKNR